MTRWLRAGVAAALTVGLATGCSGSSTPSLDAHGKIAPTGQRVSAPAIAGPGIGGGNVDLAALRGHVVVVNVFGSWCGPCQEEQPGLSGVADQVRAQGVDFVGLAERDDAGGVSGYQARFAVHYPAVLDQSGSMVARFRAVTVSAPPQTLVIDKQGRVASHFVAAVLPSQLLPVISALNAEPA